MGVDWLERNCKGAVRSRRKMADERQATAAAAMKGLRRPLQTERRAASSRSRGQLERMSSCGG